MKISAAHDKNGIIKSFFSVPLHSKANASILPGDSKLTVSLVDLPGDKAHLDEEDLRRTKKEFRVDTSNSEPRLVTRI